MKNVLIVDNKSDIVGNLATIVKKVDEEVNVFTANNLDEAFAESMKNSIGLFLVDIVLDNTNIDDVSGIKFAQKIRNISQYKFTPLIFVTSLEDPKLFAYRELHCYGFVEKPYDVKKMKMLIKEALEYKSDNNQNENYLYKKDGVLYSIKLNEVIYIENTERKVLMHTGKQKVNIPYIPFKRLLKELDNNSFLQCSRNYIINMYHIETIDLVNRYIQLTDIDKQIEIGACFRKRFFDELKNSGYLERGK